MSRKNKSQYSEAELAPQKKKKRRNPPTKEYRLWSLAWIGMLLLALAIGVLTFLFRSYIPDGLFIAVIVLANILVVAAIFLDSTKLRRMREDYQKSQTASSKSKAARAEQKRLRALEREQERKFQAEQVDAGEINEEDMTFFERLSYRARKSAESANIKGSGL